MFLFTEKEKCLEEDDERPFMHDVRKEMLETIKLNAVEEARAADRMETLFIRRLGSIDV